MGIQKKQKRKNDDIQEANLYKMTYKYPVKCSVNAHQAEKIVYAGAYTQYMYRRSKCRKNKLKKKIQINRTMKSSYRY